MHNGEYVSVCLSYPGFGIKMQALLILRLFYVELSFGLYSW